MGTPEARTPLGVWLLLVGGLVSLGASAILIRYAGDTPPVAIAAWRTILATAILTPWALRHSRAEIGAFGRREWALILAAGGMLGLHFVAWITSVGLTTVASASVLVTTSPVFIAVLGALFLGERPTVRVAVGIVVAFAGAAMIALGEDGGATLPTAPLGNGLALLAALLVSVYLLIGRAVRQRTSFLAYFVPVNAVAAATTIGACLATGTSLAVGWPVLGLCLAIALGPGLLGHGSFTVALRYLPAAFLGLLTLAEPVLASVLALALFGETPAPLALGGIVVVLISIGVVVVGRRAKG